MNAPAPDCHVIDPLPVARAPSDADLEQFVQRVTGRPLSWASRSILDAISAVRRSR